MKCFKKISTKQPSKYKSGFKREIISIELANHENTANNLENAIQEHEGYYHEKIIQDGR